MDVKKLLASHREIDDRINVCLEEIAQLRALSEKCTMRISGNDIYRPKGTYSDKVGKNAVKIADLEIKIDREIDRLVELKERIMEIVSSLDSDTGRAVIERRYILHETWDQIADKLGYTTRHISRIHNDAIKRLEEIYGDKAA